LSEIAFKTAPYVREKVVEHRVSEVICGWRVRFWLESDPAFGGLIRSRAVLTVKDARRGAIALQAKDSKVFNDPEHLALWLLENVECANSVEVCDNTGDGTAVHRDWFETHGPEGLQSDDDTEEVTWVKAQS